MSDRSTTTANRGLYGWIAAHPALIDAGLASTILFFTCFPYIVQVLDGATSTSTTAIDEYRNLVIALALAVPLYWRRSHPIPAASVMAVVCLIQLIWNFELVASQVAVLVIISAIAGYAPRWASWTVLAVGLVSILLLAIRTGGWTTTPGASVIAMGVMTVTGWSLVGVAWLIGDLTRSRRLERAALADRADRLERERERELKLAAADERAHIAREMHDIVAHSLSIIVTQADGARYAAPPNAGPVVPALEAIAETARTSLTDMRRLLGVLRTDDPAPKGPSPSVGDIPALVDSVRDSGLPVGLSTGGAPRELSQGAELVLFRVVQESLTNVMKHAGPGARARVHLLWQDHDVRISVNDSGRGLDDLSDTAGHGIGGMQERLALYGGEVTVTPSEDGGVQVLATMPYASAVAGG